MDERHQKVENQIFYDLGSTIKLKCMVENIVGEQPEYIIWKKGNRMLNYDTERGGIRSGSLSTASGAFAPTSGAFHKAMGVTFFFCNCACIHIGQTFVLTTLIVAACEQIFWQAELSRDCTLPGPPSQTRATTPA